MPERRHHQACRLRDAEPQETRSPISIAGHYRGRVDDALWSYRDHTGLCLDNTGPLYFKHLPVPARQALAELLAGFDRAQAWPWRVLGHALALLGKTYWRGKDDCSHGLFDSSVVPLQTLEGVRLVF